MKHNPKPYEVLRKPRTHNGWTTIRFQNEGRYFYAQAKVFTVPSKYGIGARDNDGNWLCNPDQMPESARISKMAISGNPFGWGTHAVYNYDRGLDYDNTPPGLLDTAIHFVLESCK